MLPPRKFEGLSPSSLATFTSCARKYYLSKIEKAPRDSDADQSTEALDVGKAFHKCLEDVAHELQGFTFNDCLKTSGEFGLDEDQAALIFSMLGAYKRMHEKAGLKAVAWEVNVDVPAFYGFIDVILSSPEGSWWMGDMKTMATLSMGTEKFYPRHVQLNLYAAHVKEVAETVGLDPNAFKGCRLRAVTKSKAARKDGEETASYIKRLSKVVKAVDFILPIERMVPQEILNIHKSAFDFIGYNKNDKEKFLCNHNSCFNYFRACEYFSRCHGAEFTAAVPIEMVSSE